MAPFKVVRFRSFLIILLIITSILSFPISRSSLSQKWNSPVHPFIATQSSSSLFFLPPGIHNYHSNSDEGIRISKSQLFSSDPSSSSPQQQEKRQQQVILDPTLTDDRITSLFAWISCAFRGESNYDNLMLGIVAVFGVNLDEKSMPKLMARAALTKLPGLKFNETIPSISSGDNNKNNVNNGGNLDEEEFYIEKDEIAVGASLPIFERERASLGAMGAAQWTGQWRTRPHALLEIRNTNDSNNFTCLQDWITTLPRGCKRTLKKANAIMDSKNVTVTTKPIYGNQPAPHSTLAHFRCVVEHEVRLISPPSSETMDDTDEYSVEYFFEALSEAVGRYVGTTQMTGYIREYRNTQTNQIIAFAHEVRKGRTIRGQWFYATDEASKSYVWFHSVQDLVRRAIENEDIDVVDLGPSGSDAFSDLKARYGFQSVEDWPNVADYQGPFFYEDGENREDDSFMKLFNLFR